MKLSFQKVFLIGLTSLLFLSGCASKPTEQAAQSNSDESVGYTVLPEGTAVVTVALWETDDCSGEPVGTLTFPVEYADQECYVWAGNSGENSATNFSCGENSFSYTQWTSLTCSGGQRPEGTNKTVYTTQCKQDVPPTLYSQIVDFSGCSGQ